MKIKPLLLSLSLAGSLVLAGCSGGNNTSSADLDRVLDITSDTLNSFENSAANTKDDAALGYFSQQLEQNLNTATPPAHQEPIGLILQDDGSMLGYQDDNRNSQQDSGEPKLFTLEVDAERQRLIATDANDTVRDHHFSGTSLLAGYLLGSMLSRQRAAGVNPKSLSGKAATPRSSSQSARSRAGSGSYRSGK